MDVQYTGYLSWFWCYGAGKVPTWQESKPNPGIIPSIPNSLLVNSTFHQLWLYPWFPEIGALAPTLHTPSFTILSKHLHGHQNWEDLQRKVQYMLLSSESESLTGRSLSRKIKNRHKQQSLMHHRFTIGLHTRKASAPYLLLFDLHYASSFWWSSWYI